MSCGVWKFEECNVVKVGRWRYLFNLPITGLTGDPLRRIPPSLLPTEKKSDDS